MLVYKIDHTEDGEHYDGPVNVREVDTVDHISDLLPYCVVGDTVTITVLDMSPAKFEALPEFEGY